MLPAVAGPIDADKSNCREKQYREKQYRNSDNLLLSEQ
jgi:hypothetical protein